MRYVIICSVGRTGTTLLQGILNSIDGWCIRGENGNVMLGLYRAYRSIRFSQEKAERDSSPAHPWYGAERLDAERFLADCRTMLVHQWSLPPGTAVAGFKEIRWARQELGDVPLEDYLRFIVRALGDVRFLLLTRNLAEIFDSQRRASFWHRDETGQEAIRSAEILFQDMRAMDLPIYELDYEDIVNVTPRLVAMYDFLGAAYDEARLKAVLSTPHSYANARQPRA